MKTNNPHLFKNLAYDLPAGIVVFLVALPLCLGIALASGAPLFSGIIAGIVGGTVIACASGSALSVSGPAAGLTVIVFNAIQTLGTFEAFLTAVVLGGALQILLGYMKAGIIGYYFPSNVIKGMLAAIGIILILKQIPHALGYDPPGAAGSTQEGEGMIGGLLNMFQYIHPGAVAIALVSLAILIAWEKPALKKFRFFQVVPGALVVVIVGILLNEGFRLAYPSMNLSGDKLVVLPVAASLGEFISQFTLPDFSALGNYDVYVIAVTLAIVASLESLLSVEAADKLDPYKRNTPTNRELRAQGLGNIVSGMIGGLPLTAVIVRSSANIHAGARTKMSSVIHGLLLLLSVLTIAPLLNRIPLASLAALLLVVGYKLARISLFKQMYRLGWPQFLPFLVTVLAIQFSDLLRGIGIGLTVSLFFILRDNYRRAYFFRKEEYQEGDRIIIELAEEVTFLNKGSIARTLDRLPERVHVIIDGTRSHTIDPDVVEMIHDFRHTAELKKINLELRGIPAFNGVAAH